MELWRFRNTSFIEYLTQQSQYSTVATALCFLLQNVEVDSENDLENLTGEVLLGFLVYPAIC